MGFLVELLGGVLSNLVCQAITCVPGLVSRLLKESVGGMKPGQIKELLDALGTTSSDKIRALVYRELGRDPRITPRQKEDVAAALISLARGVTLLNSQGDPRSLYVRAEDLLQQLLEKLQPVRRAGEAAFPNDAWVLQHFLGMGAFGEVWLATNGRAPALGKRAYKFFTLEGAADWLDREKDRLLAVRDKLRDHPQIVRLIDVGVPPQGYPYLAFEYVAGGSLEDWISDADRKNRPIRKNEIMRGIVRAIAAAHRQQVYHCDLKPANILLTPPPDVQPKIADFGLGHVESAGSEEPSSPVEALAGTPMYLPPEALRPFAPRNPALYDTFALGVVWYQLLTERLERPAYDFATELRDSGVDSHTIALISRCLAHPDRRFTDAVQLAEQMDQVDLPAWNPPPKGLYDVQDIVREFVAHSAK